MADRYEYRVRTLPTNPVSGAFLGPRIDSGRAINTEALEKLLNEQGAECFELVTISVDKQLVFFQKAVYIEPLSDEHINAVVKAAQSGAPPILNLTYTTNRGGKAVPVVGDEAWRSITARILGES